MKFIKITRLCIQLLFFIFLLSFCIFFANCEKDFSGLPKGNVAQPPDTTSHNFVWKVDTFGTQSSVLYDVAIINENDIWAVGEIYTANDNYNAIHWNGIKWELVKIPVRIFNTSTFITSKLKAIIAFSSNNILVTNGGEVITYNGLSWGNWTFLFSDLNDTTFGGINKFWAERPDKVYGVGDKGNIFLGDGQNWQKLDSGTDVDIKDIWGAKNETSGEYEILAVASNSSQIPQSKALLKIEGTEAKAVSDSGLAFGLSGIWFENKGKYYVAGDGVFCSEVLEKWEEIEGHPLLYKDCIRGNSSNDIIIAGSFGLISHFNGNDWKHYINGEIPSFYGRYRGLSVFENMFVAVGSINAVNGIILRGKRMP